MPRSAHSRRHSSLLGLWFLRLGNKPAWCCAGCCCLRAQTQRLRRRQRHRLCKQTPQLQPLRQGLPQHRPTMRSRQRPGPRPPARPCPKPWRRATPRWIKRSAPTTSARWRMAQSKTWSISTLDSAHNCATTGDSGAGRVSQKACINKVLHIQTTCLRSSWARTGATCRAASTTSARMWPTTRNTGSRCARHNKQPNRVVAQRSRRPSSPARVPCARNRRDTEAPLKNSTPCWPSSPLAMSLVAYIACAESHLRATQPAGMDQRRERLSCFAASP